MSEPSLSFSFEVDPGDSSEVHRERAGQHHHYTLVSGTLARGVVRIGEHVALPSTLPSSGEASPAPVPLVATVRGFDGADAAGGFSVRADDGPRRLSLMVWAPAAPKGLLAAGIAGPCDPGAYPGAVVALLAAAPSVFFHSQEYRATLPACLGCRASLSSIPGVVTHLRRLLGHEDQNVVDGVREVLAGLHRG
jgi:hypothetical protein